jgi:hypothetical protein
MSWFVACGNNGRVQDQDQASTCQSYRVRAALKIRDPSTRQPYDSIADPMNHAGSHASLHDPIASTASLQQVQCSVRQSASSRLGEGHHKIRCMSSPFDSGCVFFAVLTVGRLDCASVKDSEL